MHRDMDQNAESTSPEWTATAIAADVQAGRRDPVEVVQESLRRIAQRDSVIGAFRTVREEEALADAAALKDRSDLDSLPLAGVPISIKDNVAVAGQSRRAGSEAFADEPQPTDHPVVARLKQAGAIVVGITNMPELGLYGATDNAFAVTHNPWNPARTAGGSSGGAGAAVAAGMVPVSHGNDGLGSIRIPAAACGLVGIKPGRGVVPAELGPTDWYGMAENGPLATTVADAATTLAVMADRPELATLAPPEGRLIVATSSKSPMLGVKADSAYVRALNSVATLLARAGHEVREADPHYTNGATVMALSWWMAAAQDDAAVADNPELLSSRSKTQAKVGRLVEKFGLPDKGWQQKFVDEAQEFLSAYDILVTPAFAKPPVLADEWSRGSWMKTLMGTVPWTPFAAPWNVAGFPAIAVPLDTPHPRTRTPLAVQIVARPGQEALLLSVAATIESARPWKRVAPAYAS